MKYLGDMVLEPTIVEEHNKKPAGLRRTSAKGNQNARADGVNWCFLSDK